mmetsp:Transcript_46808/g.110152  ORF Transcript_46808/g.110152 Transcript_46808/m.110152 type:complete len:282 (+) Transcript_46808:940-1785(+)
MLLFTRTDMTIGGSARLGAVDMGLAGFEAAGFTLGQRAGLQAVLDAFFLVDVALHIGLHALAGGRQRVAVDAVVLGRLDVAAGLVLRGAQLAAFTGAELAVLQVLGLQLVDLGLVALQQASFARRDLAALQAVLDALLLVHVALHGGLGGDGCGRSGGRLGHGGAGDEGKGGGGDQGGLHGEVSFRRSATAGLDSQRRALPPADLGDRHSVRGRNRRGGRPKTPRALAKKTGHPIGAARSTISQPKPSRVPGPPAIAARGARFWCCRARSSALDTTTLDTF